MTSGGKFRRTATCGSLSTDGRGFWGLQREAERYADLGNNRPRGKRCRRCALFQPYFDYRQYFRR